MAESASYLTTRNGHYYFLRKLHRVQIRVALHTRDVSTAHQRAVRLYAYTSQLHRLGLQHSEVLRLSKIHAAQLHEDGITGTDYRTPLAQPLVTPFALPTAPSNQPPPLQPPVPRPLLLQDSIEFALRDLCRSGGTEHHRKYREVFTELSQLNPGISFHEVRFAEASAHLQNLQRLPRRRTERKPYKRMPIAEVLELDIAPTELLSATSINERLKRLARLWDWAAENEAYIGTNPFRSQTLRLPEKPRARGRYTSDDINTLLQSPLFTDSEYRAGSGGRKSWWWLIFLGLFTGARVGELAQLRLEDVVTVDGVLCLSINDDGDKRVKTPAGIRLCPVHPELLRLGFTSYVEELKTNHLQHLLPYPNQNANDAGQRCSKWYCGTYRPQHLPQSWAARSLVFHSLRHTFINRAVRELQIDLHIIQAIVGHEPEGMGETRRYAKGTYRPAQLFEAMAAFQYSDIKLSSLVGNWCGLGRY